MEADVSLTHTNSNGTEGKEGTEPLKRRFGTFPSSIGPVSLKRRFCRHRNVENDGAARVNSLTTGQQRVVVLFLESI